MPVSTTWNAEQFDAYVRAGNDASQDACENAPFASVGGLDRRTSMEAPKYVVAPDRAAYLEGYRDFARHYYGEDWATCSFGWKPALIVEPLKEDWADRRARALIERMVAKRQIEVGKVGDVLETLADDFRSLVSSCEPRNHLDM